MKILYLAPLVALACLSAQPAYAIPFEPDPEIGILGGEGFSTLLSDALAGVSPDNRPCTGGSAYSTRRCWDLINDVTFQLTDITGYFVNPDCTGRYDPNFNRDCVLSLHADTVFDTLDTFYDEGVTYLGFTLSDSRGHFIPGVPGCADDGQRRREGCGAATDFQIFGVPFPAGATLTITAVNSLNTVVPEPSTLVLLMTGMATLTARRRLLRRGRS